jgi:hypothetical protein
MQSRAWQLLIYLMSVLLPIPINFEGKVIWDWGRSYFSAPMMAYTVKDVLFFIVDRKPDLPRKKSLTGFTRPYSFKFSNLLLKQCNYSEVLDTSYFYLWVTVVFFVFLARKIAEFLDGRGGITKSNDVSICWVDQLEQRSREQRESALCGKPFFIIIFSFFFYS